MGITKEFIQAELNSLEQEFNKTKDHLARLDGGITVYRFLLTKIEEDVTSEVVEDVSR